MSWFGGQRGWPDERERWLLRAASFPDQRGHEAWHQWRAGFDPERLTLQDQRLLAAAFRSLRAAGADVATDPAFELAARLYRRTWYLNNLAVRRAETIVDRLAAEQIPVIVLKGLALARVHYDDLGARPMQDVDLLVHPEDATAAVTALRGLGYEVLASEGPGLGPLKYGTHLSDADGNEVDVHFYSLIESTDDADLWEQPVNLALGRTTALALAPAEQLLHVCAHGMRHSAETPVGWIADAMAILGSSQDTLDWERLVALTVQRRLSASVGAALTWLREQMPAPVPAWVIRDLRAAPKLRLEKTIQRLATTPSTPLHFALYSWDRYRRFARAGPSRPSGAGFGRYLIQSWQLEGPAQLMTHGTRKLLPRRLAGAAAPDD